MHRTSRPTVASAAERGRTIAARSSRAAVVVAKMAARATPEVHRVHVDGSAALVLADGHPLHAAVEMTPRGEAAAMLELADTAPLTLRQPVRGLLWIIGWLRPVAPHQVKIVTQWMATEHPAPRLLDVGHGASLLWLEPASAVLSDADGSAMLAPGDLAAADPDPLCHLEADWLRHLERAHPDVLHALAQRVPATLWHDRQRVRPLGVDRFGLRLRVESADGDHNVRLAFDRPVAGPPQLAVEMLKLIGFRARWPHGDST